MNSSFNFTCAAYSSFIEYHHDLTNNIDTQEPISFLTYWLSHFILCTSSLHVANQFIPLATQLHERRNACLSKLILCGLCESLGNTSHEFKEWKNLEILLISGPAWLMQFWLNSTFEPYFKTNISPNLERSVEGTRLSQVTSDDDDTASKEIFETYFDMFYKCKTFTSIMAPFSYRNYGPTWFRKAL